MGMIVGMGISRLVEEPGKAMSFDIDEMKGAEAQWYLSLINAKDDVGSFESMKSLIKPENLPSAQKPNAKKPKTPPQTSKIVEIISEDEDDESEDEDLIPYEKPDDDAEDDDDDPTLVQRNKPAAPVLVFRIFPTLPTL